MTSKPERCSTHYIPVHKKTSDFFYHQEMTMLYYLKDARDFLAAPLNMASEFARQASLRPFSPYQYTTSGRGVSAMFEMVERSTHRYRKPSFGISSVVSSTGSVYEITQEHVMKKDFCHLIKFNRTLVHSEYITSPHQAVAPKMLVVAPYSGHYATLLRDTVGALLKDHEVWITDWENGRDVPLTKGGFNLEDYIQYLMDFIRHIGAGCHILAVCQPAVPVLAATSLMATLEDPLHPASMILMGGPIDTRVNPTQVNQTAKTKRLEWFERNVIARVPHYYLGALRRICPGFLMLSGFMSLNIERHVEANKMLFRHLIQGDEDSAESHRRFYDEYRSVLDLPADYFLDSVFHAFQNHSIPRGEFFWKGVKVNPADIRKTALLTVEGGKDDISGVGQTYAAHDLCANIPLSRKKHHLQEGVGHYGVFNGRRWREIIVPTITEFVRHAEKTSAKRRHFLPPSPLSQ